MWLLFRSFLVVILTRKGGDRSKAEALKVESAIQRIYKGGDRRLTQARTAAYLEPNRNTMQKPIEGLPVLKPFHSKNNRCHTKVQPIYKGYSHTRG